MVSVPAPFNRVWNVGSFEKRPPAGTRAILVTFGSLVLIVGVLATWGVLAAPSASAEEGLRFEQVATNEGLTYRFDGRQVVNGNPGVYVSDYDRDGWQDLLLVGNRTRGPVLFENVGGRFVPSGDLPARLGRRRIHSALFLDYDNDGWEDLLLLPDPKRPSGGYTQATAVGDGSQPTSHPLLLANHNGSFGEPTVLESVDLRPYPIGATTADYDGDGCLDVFIYQNGDWSTRTPVGYRNPSTIGDISDDNGVRNRLLRGDCSGDFTDVTAAANITGERWSLAASFLDFTGDGLPDLHVANDFNRDALYVNRGDGTFDVRLLANTDRNGMSSEVADFDGDGKPDVFVTNIGMADRGGADLSQDSGEVFNRQAAAQSPRYTKGNQLLRNGPNASFTDVAGEYGVRNAPYVWGWAAVAADLDGDGDLDIAHTNNEKSSITNAGGRTMIRWTDTPPAIWENTGTVTAPSYTHRRASTVGFLEMNARGLASLDYDRDGDLDLVGADADATVKLYRNRGHPEEWLQVTVGHSRSAGTIGARIAVTTDGRTQYRFLNARMDFLSQEGRVAHFGFDDATTVDRLTVTWPDGSTTTVRDVRTDLRVRVYHNGTIRRVTTTPGHMGLHRKGIS